MLGNYSYTDMGRMNVVEPPRRKKRAHDANKPKRSTSAYFYFMASCREQAARAGTQITKVTEFTKECSARWRNFTPLEKKPFEEKAALDKARYDREMAQYKGKDMVDPNKPKRPQTSYFLFLAEFRKMMQGKLDHKDILRKAGEQWRNMTDEQKKPFEIKSQEEAKKYEIAMAEYRKRQGGVVMLDGGPEEKRTKIEDGVVGYGEDVEEEELDDEEDEEGDEDDDE